MRTKRVLRYYCDHCAKGGFRKPSMEKHERGCCRNPNRVCGACRESGLEQKPIETLIKACVGDTDEKAVDALRIAADGCPMCMLSAIVIGRFNHRPDEDDPRGRWMPFDYKKEREEFWKEHNDTKNDGQPVF